MQIGRVKRTLRLRTLVCWCLSSAQLYMPFFPNPELFYQGAWHCQSKLISSTLSRRVRKYLIVHWAPPIPPHKTSWRSSPKIKRNNIDYKMQPRRTAIWSSNSSEILPRRSTWDFAPSYPVLITAVNFFGMPLLRRARQIQSLYTRKLIFFSKSMKSMWNEDLNSAHCW